jgi:DNA-binding CsgD family transcriptional regulator
MARENWELLMWSRLVPGLSAWQDESRVDRLREVMTVEDAVIRWQGIADSDVSPLLPLVRTPTLVMHPRDFIHLKAQEAVKLASGIPDARLTMLESDDPGSLLGRPASALAAIDEFLDCLHTQEGCEALGDDGEDASTSTIRPRVLSRSQLAFPAGDSALSPRELEVLRLLAAGHSNKQIAQMLSISLSTVHHHVNHIYTKIEAPNRAAATAYAILRGLV